MVVGVTGVPGAGKSTMVPALARRLAKAGHRPAILAVDPSSPLTGGAILGDRIRASSEGDEAIFFRSVASRGSLGGLSSTLDDVVTLLDAAGFDVILIETVGTGQSEIGVTRLAHTTLVVTAPGLGDEIQAMKAGILEVSDIVVVNKADADPRGAEITTLTLRNALADSQRHHGLQEGANPAGPGGGPTWLAPVRKVSALSGDGMDDLCEVVQRHRAFLVDTGRLEDWRRRRSLARFRDALRDELVTRLAGVHGDWLILAEEELGTRHSPLQAAKSLAVRAIQAKTTPEGRP
jgi:LAO/AO transport system kinase